MNYEDSEDFEGTEESMRFLKGFLMNLKDCLKIEKALEGSEVLLNIFRRFFDKFKGFFEDSKGFLTI